MHFICHGNNVFLISPPPPPPIFSNIESATEDSTGKSSGGIFVPKWPTQTWWLVLMQMLTNNPILLPSRKTLLTLPGNPAKIHPLYPKLELLMCHLSRDPLKAKEFRRKLQALSYSLYVSGSLDSWRGLKPQMFVMETHHVTCPLIRLETPNTQSSNFVFNDLACNQMLIYLWHNP